jgi:nitrogen regulatory protein PII
MKLISAIIRPGKLNVVRDALTEIGVRGMTAIAVKGYGRNIQHTQQYRGVSYPVYDTPMIKLEIIITTEQLAAVKAAILQTAYTGELGDGKIMVSDLEQVIRIRTGEIEEQSI